MSRPCALLFAGIFIPFLLAGCSVSVRPHQPTPAGRLAVMGPTLAFSLDALSHDWIIVNGAEAKARHSSAPSLSVVDRDGIPALNIKSGAHMSLIARRVDAMLLATPFLSWSWNVSPYGPGIHPVRLIVGFQGGADKKTGVEVLSGGLPGHDRALALVWGDSALKRGTFSLPPAERPLEAPLYTVRGGRENTRHWWLETVDLESLYTRAWPRDDLRRVHITFIGIAAAAKIPAVSARVSGIVLSH